MQVLACTRACLESIASAMAATNLASTASVAAATASCRAGPSSAASTLEAYNGRMPLEVVLQQIKFVSFEFDLSTPATST